MAKHDPIVLEDPHLWGRAGQPPLIYTCAVYGAFKKDKGAAIKTHGPCCTDAHNQESVPLSIRGWGCAWEGSCLQALQSHTKAKTILIYFYALSWSFDLWNVRKLYQIHILTFPRIQLNLSVCVCYYKICIIFTFLAKAIQNFQLIDPSFIHKPLSLLVHYFIGATVGGQTWHKCR